MAGLAPTLVNLTLQNNSGEAVRQDTIDMTPVYTNLTLTGNGTDAVVIGQPIFDETIPKLRYYGRYLTHVWVYINTLSLDIRDAMCGYRLFRRSQRPQHLAHIVHQCWIVQV